MISPHTYRLSAIALLTAGHFLSDFYGTFLPALLPIFISNLKLTLAQSGIIVMVHSMTSNLLQPFWGYYVDKSGFAWLILLGIPISAIFITLSPIAPSYFIVLIAVSLAGLGVALFHPIGSSMLNKVTQHTNPGLAMSIFIGGGNFGFAVAPAIVTYLLLHFGTTSLFLLCLPAIAALLGFIMLRMHKMELVKKQPLNQSQVQWYKSVGIIKLSLVMSLRSWTQSALSTFLTIYLLKNGVSLLTASTMLTVFLVGGALGGLAGGYIGDKTSSKTCILGLLFLSIPLTFAFFFSPPMSFTALVLLALSGACLQGPMPSSIIWAQEMLPDNKALASGMMLGLSCGLGGIGTALTGMIADHFNLFTALLISIIPTITAVALTLSINKHQAKPLTLKTGV